MKAKALTDSVTVMTLVGFALVQPLYDLLGRNAAFFVFHHAQPLDILLLVAVLSLILPGLVGGFVLLLPGRRWIVPGLLGLLTAVTLLPILGKVKGMPAGGAVALALAGGAALGWCRARYRLVQRFLLALAPAFIIFPALFLSGAQVARLLNVREPVEVAAPEVRKPVPVVFVVFDEFPLSSLLDEKKEIDAVRYPHFAALSRDAHWFRNATTVHPWTIHAVPTLLTGKYTTMAQLPRAADHPQSLFTLLARSHEQRVFESTSLCPPELNVCKKQPTFGERMTNLMKDLLLVELHLILPRQWTQDLPSVDTDWCQFGQRKQSFLDRPRQFQEFLGQLTRPANRPGLHFLHVCLPHTPLSFLPSGKGYGRDAFVVGLGAQKRWTEDEEILAHAHQRHLLQVGCVDRLVGQLVARLKETGLYDECLLVVTADHGCSFLPGGYHRKLTDENRADILRVPLFVKTPGQKTGGVSDRNVQHVDVLPTIADVLGVESLWPTDGQSMLDTTRPAPERKRVHDRGERKDFGPTLDGDHGMLARKLERFGSGDWDRLYRWGPHAALVGRSVAERTEVGPATVSGMLMNAEQFAEVALDGAFVPARVQGSLRLTGGEAQTVPLAVAVNGVVQAVPRVQLHPGKEAIWAAMVPEESLRPGENTVEVFEVVGKDGLRPVMRTESVGEAVRYRLDGESLVGPGGRTVPIRRKAFTGNLDVFHVDQSCVTFAGWSADPRGGRLPERVVMLADGEFVHSGPLTAERPDVARVLKSQNYLQSGFNFCLPRNRFEGLEGAQFRVFAVSSDGEAAELHYQDWYTRRGKRPFRR